MSDVIKTKIAKTNDRHEAFQLLLELGVPLSVLEVQCTSGRGEIWVENSQRIFRATMPGMENGMMALMAMLAGRDPEFRLRMEEVEKPKENVNIDLLSLINDEQKIIQRLKDILWPVNPSESEILTEAAIPAIPLEVLHEQYKRVKDREAEVEDFTPPAVEAKLEEPVESQMPALAESAAEASAEQLALPVDEPEHADEMPILGDQERADTLPALPTNEVLPVLLDDPAEREDEIDLSDLAAERRALEQLVLNAQPPVVSKADVVIETKTYSSIGEEIPADDKHQQLMVTNITANDPESGLSDKQRAEMRALEVWCGEEPDKFYQPSDMPVEQDDIIDHRKAEMDALSAMLAAHSDLQRVAFEDIEPQKPDPEADKRRREYQAINEYFGEAPEKFYEEQERGEEDPLGQEELRHKVLKAMETHADPEAFHEVDLNFKDGGSIRPSWDGVIPEPVVEEAPVAETKPEDEYVPPDFEPSVYGDETSKLNFEEKHKNMLNMFDPSQDNKDLIDRAPEKDHKFGTIDKDAMKVKEKLPQGVLIGAIIMAALMPLLGLYLYSNFNMNAQADYEDQQAAAMLASEASEQESQASKPQEAFRMPAAAPPPSKPPASSGSGSGPSESSGFVTEAELSGYTWKQPARPAPQPTAAALQEGARSMAFGDQMMSLGRTDEAARIYSDGLLKCPNNPQLRLRCARAYIAMRQFQTAKVILLAGMNEAANQSEFYTYLAVLKELPRE